jgi:hypothetical protein
MVRSALHSTLPAKYDDFLYAAVGENTNGALTTVLSVLARQGVDPWEEAADLSRLPHDTAVQRLSSMIMASSGRPSNADQAAVAHRLIALLPCHIASAGNIPHALPGISRERRPLQPANLMVIAIYIAVMVFGQWVAASVFERTPRHVAASASPVPPAESSRQTTGDAETN